MDEQIGPRLWRISTRVPSPGRGIRLVEPTGDAVLPTISGPDSKGVHRLAYLAKHQETSLRLVDLKSRDSSGVLNKSSFFQRSSRLDFGGRVSPDGNSVAFISNRTGANEVWLSRLDGSNLRRLTDLKGDPVFVSWSKDSRMIAFLSAPGGVGVKRIYVMDIHRGKPVPVTGENEVVGPGDWSKDGRWLYYMSARSGTFQIWKTSMTGDLPPVQITRNGGFQAQESPDGKYVYYTDEPPPVSGFEGPERLMKVPVNGGDETLALPQIWSFFWNVADAGIYYFFPGPPKRSIKLFRFETGEHEHIGDFPDQGAALDGDMSFSRDGRRLCMSHVEHDDTNLMLIDNFR